MTGRDRQLLELPLVLFFFPPLLLLEPVLDPLVSPPELESLLEPLLLPLELFDSLGSVC